jgi:hypothetical protein
MENRWLFTATGFFMLTKKRIVFLIALIAAASFWGGVRPKRYSGEQEPLFTENAYCFAPTYFLLLP